MKKQNVEMPKDVEELTVNIETSVGIVPLKLRVKDPYGKKDPVIEYTFCDNGNVMLSPFLEPQW